MPALLAIVVCIAVAQGCAPIENARRRAAVEQWNTASWQVREGDTKANMEAKAGEPDLEYHYGASSFGFNAVTVTWENGYTRTGAVKGEFISVDWSKTKPPGESGFWGYYGDKWPDFYPTLDECLGAALQSDAGTLPRDQAGARIRALSSSVWNGPSIRIELQRDLTGSGWRVEDRRNVRLIGGQPIGGYFMGEELAGVLPAGVPIVANGELGPAMLPDVDVYGYIFGPNYALTMRVLFVDGRIFPVGCPYWGVSPIGDIPHISTDLIGK